MIELVLFLESMLTYRNSFENRVRRPAIPNFMFINNPKTKFNSVITRQENSGLHYLEAQRIFDK